MADRAKNPRFRADHSSDRPAGALLGPAERRRGADRRDPNRRTSYAGVERRQGPRRSADLPRPVWHRPLGVALAIALGVATGLALGSARQTAAPSEPVELVAVDPQQLSGVEAMHDEAEALTPAQVALDERAHELWMPRVAKIELALADPQTPEPIRSELAATLTALERVGVLRP